MANILQNSFIVGVVAGVFTGLSMLPQLIKLINEKKAKDVSIVMLVVLFVGLGLWVYYGILKKDWPLIITNGFSLLVTLAIIFFSIKYKTKK